MERMSFRVYGIDGHRQKMSFNKSVGWDFSTEKDGVRLISIRNYDKTMTNLYTEVEIARETKEQCVDELRGQISDGYFENARTGKVTKLQYMIVHNMTGYVIDQLDSEELAMKKIDEHKKEDEKHGCYVEGIYSIKVKEERLLL